MSKYIKNALKGQAIFKAVTKMDDKKDFFISYTQKDEQWATWIAKQLEDEGYSTIIQAWDFKAGTNFVANMNNALINSKRFIAVISPDYFESLYGQAEWTAAFTKDPAGEKALFIPVRIKDFKPEGLFAPIVYIDLFGVEEEEAIKRLLDGVSTDARPRNRPGFPGTVNKPKFPGQLPFNNLPYRQNPNFTGREDTIKSIRKSFESGNLTALTQAVAGLGGVGKTQIVLEYAFRYGYLYDMIWWVNADSLPTMLESYSDFAYKNNLLDKTIIDQGLILEAVWNWMLQHQNWLFIYDNAENDESINDYLPRISTGHILITSRYNDWHRLGEEVRIDVFEPGEAADFLENISHINDREGAAGLAEKLGYLPLALDQAAAYIFNNKITYEKYMELFENYKLEVFEEFKPLDYAFTVTITWNLSMDKIGKESSRQLLNICSFLAPDNIDRKIFVENNEYLPEPLSSEVQNELKYNSAISELTKYSLIKLQENKISIHRLLQEVIRQPLDKEEWLNYCATIMNSIFSFDYYDVDKWTQFSELVPHALSVAQQAEQADVNLTEAARLYHEAGRWMKQTAMYDNALEWYQKALAIREKVLGKEHPDTAFTYNNIAGIYSSHGDYKKALEWYQKSLAISEKVLGKEHPDTAATYNFIALVYSSQGDYEKALELYQKVLAINEKVLGKEHPATAVPYNNIAGIYYSQGDYEKALEWFQKALAIREKVLGEEHPGTATIYNNIAGVYDCQKDYEKALEWFQKALAIREKALGKEHPDTLATYNHIAGVYYRKGNYEKALEWYHKDLVISEKVLGKEHPDTASTYNNIAGVYSRQENHEKALEWYLKAYRVFNNRMLDHPKAKIIKTNLYAAYIAYGENAADFEKWIERNL